MNVIVTTPSLTPEYGGPSRSVSSLCAALAPCGVEVDLVSLDYGSAFSAPITPPAGLVRTELFPCRYSQRWKLLWAPGYGLSLLKRVGEASRTVLHDNGLWLCTNHAAATIARRLKLPRLVSPRGMLTPWARRHKGWKKGLAWRLYQQRDLKQAQVLHATSAKEARGFRELGFRQPIALVPNGIDLLPTVARRLPEQRERTVLFVGRLHPIKGLLNLIQAWAILRPRGWRVILAGPDEDGHEAELKRAISGKSLSGSFVFTGPVNENAKRELFQTAELLVLPSFSENFGMAVGEALAWGLPVITTHGTPWHELHSHRCGWWIEPGVEPLVCALREALSLSGALRREMGERGRKLIEAKYSWARVASDMHAVYTWMAAGGTMPACVAEN